MERPDPTLARGMRDRRARILAAARRMVATSGAAALSLRDLARAAGVTVPTIYNLLGSREEVMVALFTEINGELDDRVRAAHLADPLAVAESLAIETARIFAEDEDYYRAAFLAIEHVHRMRSRPSSAMRLYRWGDELLAAGVGACAEAGLLRGNVPLAALAALVKRSFRENLYGWAFREATLEAFRAGALTDLYVVLVADAVDDFAAVLRRKLATVAAEAHRGREDPTHDP